MPCKSGRGKDPLGKRIWSGDIHTWATVIGVVGDIHNFDLATPPRPNLYFPETDHPKTAMTIVLRTTGDPDLLRETVRRTLTRQHPDLALFRLQPMETRMAHEVAQRHFLMQVAAAFGALALFLAILGTYGLLAYEVSLREKEIGIRLALGSSREAIVNCFSARSRAGSSSAPPQASSLPSSPVTLCARSSTTLAPRRSPFSPPRS